MEQTAAFITPMTPWNSISGVRGVSEGKMAESAAQETGLFKDVLDRTVKQVYDTQADVEQKQYLLATGQLDDAHSLPIAQAKAAISLDVLISLRNKTLESYNDLVKMNI